MYLKFYTKVLKDIIIMSKYLSYMIIINCTLLGVLAAKDTNGQTVSVNDVFLTIDLENADLHEVFSSIEEQTGFTFTYFKSNIKKKQISKIQENNTSLAQILRQISRDADVQFKRVNENIYVNKKESRTSEWMEEASDLFADLDINGKITDENGDGLPGASILVKGTTKGTTTDIEGNYSLVAPEDGTLVVSFVGYISLELEVGNRSTIDVQMQPDAEQLEEIVVIGYGTQKKSDMTGAVGIVKGDELAKFTTANATNAIQGRMAGVRVESNGGAPGAAAIVTIRGSSTLSDRQPLYVIDGMLTGSMSSLNPSDIESVTVLKDASASAIYGSRAANGVVIVTTKKGKSGEISIDFDASIGTQKTTKMIEWANARQYADMVNQAIDNDNARILAKGGTSADLLSYPEATSTQFDPSIDSDIQKESLRTAPISNMSLRLSGGGENSTFSISANHLKQEGIVKESAYERMNLRANSTFTKGRFKLEETIGLTRTINNPNNYFNGERDIVPIIPMYDANGNFTAERSDLTPLQQGVNVGNSLGVATLEDRTVTRNTILGNVAGSFEIIEGLTYKLNLGMEAYFDNNYTFTPEFRFSDASTNGASDDDYLKERNDQYLSRLMEHTLMYKKSFDSHNFELLAGYSAQETNHRRLGVDARGFPDSGIRIASQAEDITDAPSFDNTSTLISYFGRLNYSFNDRYLLTASLRRDGSSLFIKDIRWGVFPSFAVGWNISNESFMSGVTFINDLKLRASYGEIGSNNAPAYVADAVLNPNSAYPLGVGSQQRQSGVSITKAVNESLRWETSKITDIGLEFGVLDNRMQFTLDYFKKESTDVIAPFTPAPWSGRTGSVPLNMASITNTGFEFMTDYSLSIGELNLNVNANFTVLDNEVTDIGLSGPIVGGGYTSNGGSASLTDVGHSIAEFYGFKVLGIYQTDEAAVADGRPNAGAGDFIFEDIDGVPGISDDDKQYLGSAIPNFEYGLSVNAQYKGLDASLFFNGVSGNLILDGNIYRSWFEDDNNFLVAALDSWTPQNTSSTLPRLTTLDPAFNREMSDFFLSSGAYFRLRNIQIGYTLPTELTEKLQISRIRVYGSAQNLFTITGYSGYYPEVGRGNRTRGSSNEKIFSAGVDEKAYPSAKTFQIGIQVSF